MSNDDARRWPYVTEAECLRCQGMMDAKVKILDERIRGLRNQLITAITVATLCIMALQLLLNFIR